MLKKKETPENFDLECTDLINKLLSRRPEARLGNNGAAELKSHVWFKDFNWREFQLKEMESPFKPSKGDHFSKK